MINMMTVHKGILPLQTLVRLIMIGAYIERNGVGKMEEKERLLGKESTHMVVDEEHIYTSDNSVVSWYTPEEWKKISDLSSTVDNNVLRANNMPVKWGESISKHVTGSDGYYNMGRKIVDFLHHDDGREKVHTTKECTKFLEKLLKDCHLYHDIEVLKRKKH